MGNLNAQNSERLFATGIASDRAVSIKPPKSVSYFLLFHILFHDSADPPLPSLCPLLSLSHLLLLFRAIFQHDLLPAFQTCEWETLFARTIFLPAETWQNSMDLSDFRLIKFVVFGVLFKCSKFKRKTKKWLREC